MKCRILIAFIALALLLLCSWFSVTTLKSPISGDSPPAKSGETTNSGTATGRVLTDVTMVALATPPPRLSERTAPLPPPAFRNVEPLPAGVSRQRAYRLMFEDGKYSLVAVEFISGRFAQRRGPQGCPGMLSIRLVAGDNRVLAEEVIHAPDHICMVLDPGATGGQPAPARLTTTGSSVFQVRFPVDLVGTRLDLLRVGNLPLTAQDKPLASIAIP